MTEKVQKLVDFFKNHKEYVPRGGIFNSRNLVGDEMKNIYCDNGVKVDVCYEYDYIEIFGLTDDEFRDAVRELDLMNLSIYYEDY